MIAVPLTSRTSMAAAAVAGHGSRDVLEAACSPMEYSDQTHPTEIKGIDWP